MRESLLISARAMDNTKDVLDVTSNNLANLDTIGYKKDKVYHTSFQEVIASRMNNVNEKYMVPSQVKVATDFSMGGFKFTEDKLNAAISGEGFFKVVMPDGNTGYTRRGVFSIDRDRQLLIGDNPVLGVEGPIFLEDSDIIIDGNGKIFNSQNQFMGQLDVVVIDDNSKLVKKGSTVFELAARANEFPATAEIKHRFLEESNVSQSNSMIEMIALLDSLRQFETHQKLIQMQDELNGKVINQVGAV